MSTVYAVSVIEDTQWEQYYNGVYKVFSSLEKAEQFIKENTDVFGLYRNARDGSRYKAAMVYLDEKITEFEVN
tara:strand:+ start:235 stop:453 length:219 start_codon:yes stop_codon:yes gene_type:complete